jgi:hypothetical protein
LIDDDEMQRRDEGAWRAIRRNRRRRVSTCAMRVKIIEWSSIGVLMRLGILCFCAYFILRLLLVRLFVAYIASRVSAALPCYPPHPQHHLIDKSVCFCYSKSYNFAFLYFQPEFLFLQWYRESSSLNIHARPAAIVPDHGTDID